MLLNKLEQILMEEKYSRKEMRKILKRDIETNCNKLLECKRLVADYLAQEFKFSRADRAENLIYRINSELIDMDRIILDLLSIILITEHEQEFTVLASLFAPHLEYEDILDGVKVAADLISVMADSDLYDLYFKERLYEGKKYKSVVCKSNYKLQQETIAAINRVKFLPPMIVKPEPIRSNSNAGFITIREHCVLKSYNQHDLPINLNVLNIQNSIPLILDEFILQFEKEFKEEKYSDKDEIELQLIKEAFINQQKEFVETYNELLSYKQFYLLHRFDSRGRMYCKGFQINYQSGEYDRALVSMNIYEEVSIPEKYK
jgi:hypothetical protein